MTEEVIRCSVPNCNSTSYNLVNFYKFPDDENDRKNWLTLIGRPELFDLPIEDLLINYFVCSLHLERKDPGLDISKENQLENSEGPSSNGSFQHCSKPTSSPIQDVFLDKPMDKNTLSHCTCGYFFISCEDFKMHIETDCPLLSHKLNENKISSISTLDTDDRSFQHGSHPSSSPIRDAFVDKPRDKNIPTYCTCGIFFISLEDFKMHVQTDCPLLSHKLNESKISNTSSPILVMDKPTDKNTPTYCTCGTSFISTEDFDMHIKTDCPLLSHKLNESKMSNNGELDNESGSFHHCSQPASSPIHGVLLDKPMDKNIPTYCTCGTIFLSLEDFNMHVENDCPLLSHKLNEDKMSDNGELDYDERIRLHMEMNINNTVPRCELCKKTFANKIRLRHHMSQHTGHRPFECKICGMTFVEKACAKTHIKSKHTDKEFRCDICNKLYNSQHYLKTHRLTHEKIKDFKCDKCSQAFTHKQALQVHLRKHTKERPFECTKCTKRFTQFGHLQTHMRIHTGETPFNCEICHKEFRQVGNLKIHMKTHNE